MRVTVVHNASAGAGKLPEHHVVHRLEAAGHTVESATDPDRDLGKRLAKRCDVVVAAGGDGTVLGVARRLVGLGVPLVILPVGTANNIAATVGVSASIDEVLDILEHPRERKMDMGVATGSWGERFFSESAGVGWFCDALARQVVSDADKDPVRALGVLADNLASYPPRRWTVTLDGRDVSGSYLLVEVLNAGMLGPNLQLTSDADPFDGALDVALVTEEDRPALQKYLARKREGGEVPPPTLTVRRAQHVHFALGGEPLRIDDAVRPKKGSARSHHADLRLLPGAVRLWLPSVVADQSAARGA